MTKTDESIIKDIAAKLVQFDKDYKVQLDPFRSDISPEQMQEYFDNKEAT